MPAPQLLIWGLDAPNRQMDYIFLSVELMPKASISYDEDGHFDIFLGRLMINLTVS